MKTMLDEDIPSIVVGSGDNRVTINLKQIKPVSYMRYKKEYLRYRIGSITIDDVFVGIN